MSKHRYPVGPGWWPLLDEVCADVKALDPEVQLSFKEKYGTCQIDFITESTEHFNAIYRLTDEAEQTSKTICEFCGHPGHLHEERSWLQTLCERCAALDPLERRKVAEDAKELYYLAESVAGSMALSDMALSEEDKERIRHVAADPEAVEEQVRRLIEKHKRRE